MKRDLRVCLNNRDFPTFLFLKSAAYAMHRVRVDSKLIDRANLHFGHWSRGHEAGLFTYINNSFPVLYVLKEITQGLVSSSCLQDVEFSRDSVLHILIVA